MINCVTLQLIVFNDRGVMLEFLQLPDSLPENLANADCFEERNESEVPVFDLSRASRAENDGSSPHYRHAENQKN